jgi:chemotaxis protein CheY-P-specific phosphatase CheC
MINTSQGILEKAVQKAFQSGFANASHSLSQLAKSSVYYDNFHTGYFDLGTSALDERYQQDTKFLLTTEVFGEITGKSYLYLSQRDFEFLTQSIPEHHHGDMNLRKEFIKEVDNILSAAVITRLSNELNLKMFGDIPVLLDNVASRLEDIIYTDFNKESDRVFINSIHFSFENHPDVRLLFVWVFDTSLMGTLEKKEKA